MGAERENGVSELGLQAQHELAQGGQRCMPFEGEDDVSGVENGVEGLEGSMGGRLCCLGNW